MRSYQLYTIGRADSCDMVLRDSSISKRHAELVVTKDKRYYLTDCGSTNGTYISIDNQWERIRQCFIEPDKPLRLGKCHSTIAQLMALLSDR